MLEVKLTEKQYKLVKWCVGGMDAMTDDDYEAYEYTYDNLPKLKVIAKRYKPHGKKRRKIKHVYTADFSPCNVGFYCHLVMKMEDEIDRGVHHNGMLDTSFVADNVSYTIEDVLGERVDVAALTTTFLSVVRKLIKCELVTAEQLKDAMNNYYYNKIVTKEE